MPRSGINGTYSLPGAQATQVPGTPIPSAVNNQGWSDAEQTFNTIQPVAYGGTGASTFVGAADNLSPAFVNVASGATTNIGAASSPNVNITGTTTITAFDSFATAAKRLVKFTGVLTLTHNATSLILPGGSNITTAPGDFALFVSQGSGNWECVFYTYANSSSNLATVVDTLRNRVVNGDKLVSQENAQTAGTTNGRYLSDQNAMYFVTSAGVFTGVNVQTLSPAGGYRDRITITTADASLAAGEYLTYTQSIEGSNIRDAKWGAAGAVPIIVRRGFKFPAGTYTVAFHNSGATRSYVTSFVVSGGEANTDIVREFSIPGDTTGTWLSADGVIGLTMDVVIAAGTTFQTTANAWQAGNFLTIAGSTNGVGTGAAVYEFFDEGLKLDPDATGVYGQYEVGPVDAVYRPERYLEVLYSDTNTEALLSTFYATAPDFYIAYWWFKARKCKAPTFSLATGASWQVNTPTTSSFDDRFYFRNITTGRFFMSSPANTRAGIANARLS